MSAKRKSRGLYARLMGDWHSHPKVMGISLEARGLWASLASWSAHARADGVFAVGHASALAHGKHAKPLRELIAAGLVDDLGDGRFKLHGWEEHNMTRDDHEQWKASERERWDKRSGVRKGGRLRAESSRSPGGEAPESEWSTGGAPSGVRLERHDHAHREGSYPREGGYPYSDADREEIICGPWLSDDEAAQ